MTMHTYHGALQRAAWITFNCVHFVYIFSFIVKYSTRIYLCLYYACSVFGFFPYQAVTFLAYPTTYAILLFSANPSAAASQSGGILHMDDKNT